MKTQQVQLYLYSRLPWLLLAAIMVMLFIHNNPGPDYWYHLFLGQEVLKTGNFQPPDTLIRVMPEYLNLYWLYQSIQFFLYRAFGQLGPCLMYIGLGFVTSSFWCLAISPSLRRHWYTLWLALACLLIWNSRFEWRPEMVSYAAISLFVYVLVGLEVNKPLKPSIIAAIAVVQWIWTNSHGYFVLGPILIFLTLAIAWQKKDSVRWRSLLVLLLVSLLASLAGPFHFKVWQHVFHLSDFLNSMTSEIQEFMPGTHPIYLRVWTTIIFWIFWISTAFTILWSLYLRKNLVPLMFAMLAVYLSGRYYRNIPLLPLLAGPLWSTYWLTGLGSLFKNRSVLARRATFVFMSTLALVAVGVITGGYYKSRFSSTRLGLEVLDEHVPRSFAQFMNGSSFTGKIFNNSSDGGYLQLIAPKIRVYGDSRFTDKAATLVYFNAQNDFKEFESLNRLHSFDGALVRIIENQVLVHNMLTSPDWTLAYSDLHFAFFISEKTNAGSTFLPRQYNFYNGEDIEQGDNLYKALQWTKFLAAGQRNTLLEVALDHYLSCTLIHPGVMAIAIRYYQSQEAIAKLRKLRELQPRIKDIPGKDFDFVKSELQSNAL